jgi:hypothetical protein
MCREARLGCRITRSKRFERVDDPADVGAVITMFSPDRLTELFEMRAVPEGLCARSAAATFDETEAAMRRHIESTQGDFTVLPPVG